MIQDWPALYKFRLVRRLREEFDVHDIRDASPLQIDAIVLDDIRNGGGPVWTPSTLRAMRYSKYLEHPHWRFKRMQKLFAVDGKCERCGGRARDIHHKTYERMGEEPMDDLEALCRPCHALEHDKPVEQAQALADRFQPP